RDAVVEGWLIDHEPPYQFETQLKDSGIVFKAGEEVSVYHARTGTVETEVMEDEVKIEVEQFNKRVITESFNRVILGELANHISPDDDGKTLIFAVTDDHADTVVRLLKHALEEKYGPVDDRLVMKITGSLKDPLGAIQHFKNERLPKIVVTVDLLTTGIDVPAISNLVFLRRVRSRILYEQMLGRATRRCDEIGKDHFNIFDAVGLYESLKPYTSMKPVVAGPNISLKQLVDEYEEMDEPEHRKKGKEELIAKIQRKKRRWSDEDREAFQELSGGRSIDDFIRTIEETDETKLNRFLKEKQNLIQFIDENRNRGEKQYISEHEDKLTGVKRGYGHAEKPEDYLAGFNRFIRENMNTIPALRIVCTRPKDLTREQLKQLARSLDQNGYSETGLRTAWREAKNEDIAADIISFIRQQALGDPLVSHEERIQQAMKKIYRMKVWTKPQKTWLERIEKQLLKESVLHPDPKEAFNVEPFKSKGGYNRLNKIFDGELDDIVHTINQGLYEAEGKQA
ncbi:MAG TPA: type I restriction-modification system endonuclease, partial [Bacillales bacterium]|nr:type I restriction-modification system endonuclease [Bacillales bacterium]